MVCQVCRTGGDNMRKCKKCGQIYCCHCATKGRGSYPKVRAGNMCPWCGSTAGYERAR